MTNSETTPSAGRCNCSEGYGRADADEDWCEACLPNCGACTVLDTYEACSVCVTSTQAYDSRGEAYKYCEASCATGYTTPASS